MTERGTGQAAANGRGAVADFDNLCSSAAIARADETIRGYMKTSTTMTSGERSAQCTWCF
ncbi:hypothetical protein D4M24_12155 [Escherichia coli]|nr:hypothetical protein D4M24_12155 [Escherichia coli]